MPDKYNQINENDALNKACNLSSREFSTTINKHINKISSEAILSKNLLLDAIKTPKNIAIQKDADLRREYMRKCNDAIISQCG